jgi:hypothetical protein
MQDLIYARRIPRSSSRSTWLPRAGLIACLAFPRQSSRCASSACCASAGPGSARQPIKASSFTFIVIGPLSRSGRTLLGPAEPQEGSGPPALRAPSSGPVRFPWRRAQPVLSVVHEGVGSSARRAVKHVFQRNSDAVSHFASPSVARPLAVS